MTDMKHIDWTDSLREHLSSSEIQPSPGLWSKVEGAATAGAERVGVFKLALWAAGISAAAAVLTMVVLHRGNTNIDPAGAEPSSGLYADAAVLDDTLTQAFVATEMVSAADGGTAWQAAQEPLVKESEEKEDTVTGYVLKDYLAEIQSVEITDEATPEEKILAEAEPGHPTFNNLPNEAVKHRNRPGVSLFASGLPVKSGANSPSDIYVGNININGSINGSYFYKPGSSLVRQDLRHHLPLSAGISLTFPLPQNWFLESGLNYTFLWSEYPDNIGDQKLHFLGLPVKAGYRFNTPSNFFVSLSSGIMGEKCIYGTALGSQVKIKDLLFSAVATAAVNYKVWNDLSLFLAPEVSYYFTKTDIPTYRTEKPVSVTLRLGVNYDFGKRKPHS